MSLASASIARSGGYNACMCLILGHADTLTQPSHGLRAFAEKRQAEAARIRDKYPDRIPVRASVRGTASDGR